MPADQRPTGGQTAWRRRTVLTAVAAVPAAGLTGCSLRVGQPATASPPSGPSPEELARGRAAADADALAAAAVRTASLVPSAARTLRTVADEHEAHAAALRDGGAAVHPTATASSTPSASAGAAASPAAALRALATREQQAVTALEADLAAVQGSLARLLASVAACRTVHVMLLGRLAEQAARKKTS